LFTTITTINKSKSDSKNSLLQLLRVVGLSSLSLLFCYCEQVQAQTATQTPYSAFGIGDLTEQTLSRNSSMGKIGVGSFNRASLGSGNPASYTDLSLTTFDLAGYAQGTSLRSNGASSNQITGSVQGIALGFPSQKHVAFCFGAAPYSSVGYSILQNQTVQNDTGSIPYTSTRQGSGGVNKAFIGAAYKLGRLSVGMNINYFFGSINDSWRTLLYSTSTAVPTNPYPNSGEIIVERKSLLNGISASFGINYTDTLSKKWLWRIGMAYDLGSSLHIRQHETYQTLENNVLVVDTAYYGLRSTTRLPANYSVGLGLELPNKFSFGADFSYQDWTGFHFTEHDSTLHAGWKIKVGGEYIPNYRSDKYYKWIAYRAGFFYQQTPLSLQQQPVVMYGMTMGVGIPLRRQLSRINVGVELQNRGTPSSPTIQELSCRFVVGVSFTEKWFMHRKYD